MNKVIRYHENPAIDAAVAHIRRCETEAASLVVSHIAHYTRAAYPGAVAVRYEAGFGTDPAAGAWELHVGNVVLPGGLEVSPEDIEASLFGDLDLLLSLDSNYQREDGRIDFSAAS